MLSSLHVYIIQCYNITALAQNSDKEHVHVCVELSISTFDYNNNILLLPSCIPAQAPPSFSVMHWGSLRTRLASSYHLNEGPGAQCHVNGIDL